MYVYACVVRMRVCMWTVVCVCARVRPLDDAPVFFTSAYTSAYTLPHIPPSNLFVAFRRGLRRRRRRWKERLTVAARGWKAEAGKGWWMQRQPKEEEEEVGGEWEEEGGGKGLSRVLEEEWGDEPNDKATTGNHAQTSHRDRKSQSLAPTLWTLASQGLSVLTRSVLYQLLVMAASYLLVARSGKPAEVAAHQVGGACGVCVCGCGWVNGWRDVCGVYVSIWKGCVERPFFPLTQPIPSIPPLLQQLAMQLWLLPSILLDALGIVGQGLVADCLGRGRIARARKIAKTLLRYGAILGAAVGVKYLVLGAVFILPTIAPDAAVASRVRACGWIVMLCCAVLWCMIAPPAVSPPLPSQEANHTHTHLPPSPSSPISSKYTHIHTYPPPSPSSPISNNTK